MLQPRRSVCLLPTRRRAHLPDNCSLSSASSATGSPASRIMFTGWLCRSRRKPEARGEPGFSLTTRRPYGIISRKLFIPAGISGSPCATEEVAMSIATRTLPSAINSHSRRRRAFAPLIVGLGLAGLANCAANAADVYLPIVMPITGFLSVEGGSQRNGAVMALEQAPGGLKADFPIFDTGTSATGAATALDKALSSQKAVAAAVTVFGTEMVAMMPIAAEYKVPLLTISGLAKITESGNPYIFRFLPND